MTRHVTANTGLAHLARKAFLSWMKAYQTFPKALKPIFSVKALHSGHVASSFCLGEAPRKVAQAYRTQEYGAKGKYGTNNDAVDGDDGDVKPAREYGAVNYGKGKSFGDAHKRKRNENPFASSFSEKDAGEKVDKDSFEHKKKKMKARSVGFFARSEFDC